MSEQNDHEEINESIILSRKLDAVKAERDKLEDTLIKANSTITNLIREKSNIQAQYTELRKDDLEMTQAGLVLSTLLQKIEQEVVDVEKVDPENQLAKRLRFLLGHDSDPRAN